MSRPCGIHLPAGPLLALIADRRLSMTAAAARIGVPRERLQRARVTGTVTEPLADAAAVAFGLHPAQLWPLEWGLLDACAAADDQWASRTGEQRRRAYEQMADQLRLFGPWEEPSWWWPDDTVGLRPHRCALDGCRCGRPAGAHQQQCA